MKKIHRFITLVLSTKTIIRLSLVLLIILSIFLIILAVGNDEWNTVVACLALIIAIISSGIAFETFNNINEQKKPYLRVIPDLKSRFGLIQLKLSNQGEHPAFNVKINWKNHPINLKNEKIKFNKFRSDIDAVILNSKEEVFVILDGCDNYYSKNKNTNMSYSGEITYILQKDSKIQQYQKFEFSLEHYATSPTHEEEGLKTSFELQQIPKKLAEINNTIKQLKN